MFQREVVQSTDDAMAELMEIYLEAAHKDVADLETLIGRALGDAGCWAQTSAEIRRITHNVKGQGSSFGYPLMTKIGESLSRLMKSIDEPETPVLKLVEAHVSALKLVLEQDIRDEAGEHGKALLERFRLMVDRLAEN